MSIGSDFVALKQKLFGCIPVQPMVLLTRDMKNAAANQIRRGAAVP